MKNRANADFWGVSASNWNGAAEAIPVGLGPVPSSKPRLWRPCRSSKVWHGEPPAIRGSHSSQPNPSA